eukprot:CAMPEP_0204345348 /NCGR_PEP_ID=MMETSP0469-20131031/26323_1 /ASSEMBLY_ACC=CAM_ASM_000384 /TAXON_ID=2969 /ORGANISM="Oxyrrhis marina" /LENGTH=48 /DNA_ID= /DNA_START= /DNA_END= /DNA_ORIENTATION=
MQSLASLCVALELVADGFLAVAPVPIHYDRHVPGDGGQPPGGDPNGPR